MLPSFSNRLLFFSVNARKFHTNNGSFGKVQDFLDKYTYDPLDANKRPSMKEIVERDLPRNTPTLQEVVSRLMVFFNQFLWTYFK